MADVKNSIGTLYLVYCCSVLNSSRVILLHLFFDQFSNQETFNKCEYKNLEPINVFDICSAHMCVSAFDFCLLSVLSCLEFEVNGKLANIGRQNFFRIYSKRPNIHCVQSGTFCFCCRLIFHAAKWFSWWRVSWESKIGIHGVTEFSKLARKITCKTVRAFEQTNEKKQKMTSEIRRGRKPTLVSIYGSLNPEDVQRLKQMAFAKESVAGSTPLIMVAVWC